MTTRCRTSSSLSWPCRATRKNCVEVANPSECHSSAHRRMHVYLPVYLLKAVLQNLNSHLKSLLQQLEHATMPATYACKQKFTQQLPEPLVSHQCTPEVFKGKNTNTSCSLKTFEYNKSVGRSACCMDGHI